MFLIPFDRFSISTKKSADQVMTDIRDNTRMQETLTMATVPIFGSEDAKLFAGELYERKFKIQRIIVSPNAYLPVIHGNVTEEGEGCRVEIKMDLNKANLIASGIILILALYMFIRGLNEMNQLVYLWLAAFVVAYGVMIVRFKGEMRKAINLLREIINR